MSADIIFDMNVISPGSLDALHRCRTYIAIFSNLPFKELAGSYQPYSRTIGVTSGLCRQIPFSQQTP